MGELQQKLCKQLSKNIHILSNEGLQVSMFTLPHFSHKKFEQCSLGLHTMITSPTPAMDGVSMYIREQHLTLNCYTSHEFK